MFRLAPLALLLVACGTSRHLGGGAESDDDQTDEVPGHRHNHVHHRFDEPEKFAKTWNDPSRDAWQKPQALIEAMEVEPGMVVADLGTGTGYFVPHLSRAVGDQGEVLAADIEPNMLRYVEKLAEDQELGTVQTVLSQPDHPALEPASVDRILTVNTWHHFQDRPAYAALLLRALKPGGSLWVVDLRKDSPMGPPPEHRLEPSSVIADLQGGGFRAETYPIDLDRQFVVVGRPAPKVRPTVARGNEPFWMLQITGTEGELSRMGEDPIPFTVSKPVVTETQQTWTATEPALELRLTQGVCHDSMTGMPYPSTAALTLGSERLSGCGGEPIELLQGPWIVRALPGSKVSTNQPASFRIGPDGEVSGHGGCNRFGSKVTLSGEGLSFEPAMATKMACEGVRMDQENALLLLLPELHSFDIKGGDLILRTGDGREVRAGR